jgi:hypothetical protein
MTKFKSFKGEVIDSITDNESGMIIITCESGKFLALSSSFLMVDDDLPFVEEIAEPKKEPKEEVVKEEVKKEVVKEEVKKETPKAEPKKEPVKEEFYTWEDLENMDKENLIELITDEDLDIDHENIKSTSKLRKAVAEEIGVEVPED